MSEIRLSPHFTLAEMCQSQTASRKGINNVPSDPEIVANLQAVCEHVLEPVRSHYGVVIIPSSGYRCPALNAAVGGSRTSQHMTGEAADFTVSGVPCDEVCDWIRKNLEFDQVILEFWNPQTGTGWVHGSFRRKGKNRKQFLKIG